MTASYRSYEFLRATWSQVWPDSDPKRGVKFESLMDSYDSPTRHYHTAEHLRECLNPLYVEFDGGYSLILGIAEAGTRMNAVVLALFYHDAVWRPGEPGPDPSVTASAELFLDHATGIIDKDTIALVTKAIRMTDYGNQAVQMNAQNHTPESRLVQDLDLNIFGLNPERGRQRMFEYEKQIWLEHSAPSPAVKLPGVWASLYHSGRTALVEQLHNLAVQDQLFKVIRCKSDWNDNARHNLSFLRGVLHGYLLFGR